jgi:hypothetical protein
MYYIHLLQFKRSLSYSPALERDDTHGIFVDRKQFIRERLVNWRDRNTNVVLEQTMTSFPINQQDKRLLGDDGHSKNIHDQFSGLLLSTVAGHDLTSTHFET